MSPQTVSRLMRSSIDYTTAPARRSTRARRRDKVMAVRVLVLCAVVLAYFGSRAA